MKVMSAPRGVAPRTPLQRRSLAAAPARSAPLARSLRSLAMQIHGMGSRGASQQREPALGEEDQRRGPDQPRPQRKAPLGLASARRARIERADRSRRA